ncbi:reverse transcriptase [Nitrosomonas sp. HPC101]|nr:reverse transcriptase [Nitrosomonas sp. HPC101]
MSPTRKSVLDLNFDEVRNFFLKAESYCNLDFPPYIRFDELINKVVEILNKNSLSGYSSKPRDHDGLNYTILNNKDGRYAWRPFQLIHPALYVSLVHQLTTEPAWQLLRNRFSEFSSNPNITCLSLPVVSLSTEKDKAEQISHWWQEVEQRSIEMSLEYEYLLETDITDCYGAIYTHSIAWAIHGKTEAKAKRTDKSLLGNQIDSHIQDMRHGQTNGIPQGSVLMDFIAEIVLGFADLELAKKINSAEIVDYRILRYRDDYRIFVNNPQDGEQILKFLTEITIDLGLKLNPGKTKASSDVVRSSIKNDKMAWIARKHTEKSIQKHLFIIHDHASQYQNSGSLAVALNDYFKRISRLRNIDQVMPLIAIVTDIAFRNPRTYAICAAILSKLINFLVEDSAKQAISEKIRKKFDCIPNTGYMQIWIQRATHLVSDQIQFDEPICKLVLGEDIQIWNCDWISNNSLKKAILNTKIIDKAKLADMDPVMSISEIELFSSQNY